MQKIKFLLCLLELKGCGLVSINRLYSSLSVLPDNANVKYWMKNVFTKYSESEIDIACDVGNKKYDYLSNQNSYDIITIFDYNYPNQLNALGLKRPLILYCKGDMSLLSSKNVAVIGSRMPSEISIKLTKSIIKKIVDSSINVVSGLAYGCDTIAHQNTLENHGKTIAVLPSGLSVITPSGNQKLFDNIITNGGLAISEYYPNTESSKYSFIERDRLIAGLSEATIVIECKKNSGTMHTVNYALEYKRRIGCLLSPNTMDQASFEGNYYLINNKNAKAILNEDDIYDFIVKTSVNNDFDQLEFDLFNGGIKNGTT